MYQISQEEKDKIFQSWIADQNQKIEILAKLGFDRDQAIEMLKLQQLCLISQEIGD